MKRAMTVGIAMLAALTQACATQAAKDSKATALEKPQATIPFINMRSSIETWQADGEDAIWLQDSRKHWYYAQLFAPCTGLEFAVTLGIRNTPMNRLDRFSELVVPDQPIPCQLRSLVKSDPPPPKQQKKADSDAK